jgi:hypothetical protein
VPAVVAFVFGFFAFRSRIKGVYFSIITQALTYAAMLLFFRNETGFGGNNGFTDFKRILGMPIATPQMRMTLFVLTGLTLLGFFLLARWLVAASSAACCRHPRRRDARDVLGLQPDRLQARHLDAVGRHVRRGRRAVRAAGGHHQPGRDEPGQLDRDRDLGGGRRPCHAGRPHRRRLHRQRRQELAHRQRAGVLAVLPGRAVHRRHAVPADGVAGLVRSLDKEEAA